FVQGGTLSQQLAAAIAAEIRGARTLSAFGELRFLALLHADDELALRETLEGLRGRLDARPWLSETAPARLHLSIGCMPLNPQLQSVEEAIERVRALCAAAQGAGGARCEFDLRATNAAANEDPQVRLVRAILRSPSVRGTAQFAFQPLVPLAGHVAGQ